MSPSSRKVYDFILVMSLISIACFVPSRNGDPTIHVDKHLTTWKNALDRCAGRGEQLVSIQNLSDKDKDILLPKLEKDVPFWTMSINISQVVAWAGCVEEESPNAFSLQDIRMSYFGTQISLPKCLGYCLRLDTYAAVGLRADGMCMCFYDMKALTVPKYCDRNCSPTCTVMDECEKNFVSLYKIVPTGEVLTAEEELLSTGKCVYFDNDANKHFKVSSCDRVMRGFRCQTHDGFHIYNISATWQEANIACRKANMILFWNHHHFVAGSFLWTGFFVSPTTIISPDYNAEGRNCPIIWKTEKGNLKLGTDNCENSHHYLCIQACILCIQLINTNGSKSSGVGVNCEDKKSVSHTGSSDRDSQIVGAVVGSFVAIILIAAVAVVIYRRRAKGRGSNKMIFDNRMYQEVMETDRLGCRPAVRNESNQVSNIHCDEKRMSNIYAAYAEITESHVQVEAKPGPTAANSKISQRVHGECLHYASSNITQLTGYTNISTITEQSGMRQTFVEDDNKPVAMAEKQTEKEYETIF